MLPLALGRTLSRQGSSFSSHFYLPADLTAKYFCGKGWLFLWCALFGKGKWGDLRMTATCSKPLDKRPKEAGLEGHHPTCSRLGSGRTHTGLLGAPECRLAGDSCAAVGSVGPGEAVLIYCCLRLPSWHQGTRAPAGRREPGGSQRSESREDVQV